MNRPFSISSTSFSAEDYEGYEHVEDEFMATPEDDLSLFHQRRCGITSSSTSLVARGGGGSHHNSWELTQPFSVTISPYAHDFSSPSLGHAHLPRHDDVVEEHGNDDAYVVMSSADHHSLADSRVGSTPYDLFLPPEEAHPPPTDQDGRPSLQSAWRRDHPTSGGLKPPPEASHVSLLSGDSIARTAERIAASVEGKISSASDQQRSHTGMHVQNEERRSAPDRTAHQGFMSDRSWSDAYDHYDGTPSSGSRMDSYTYCASGVDEFSSLSDRRERVVRRCFGSFSFHPHRTTKERFRWLYHWLGFEQNADERLRASWVSFLKACWTNSYFHPFMDAPAAVSLIVSCKYRFFVMRLSSSRAGMITMSYPVASPGTSPSSSLEVRHARLSVSASGELILGSAKKRRVFSSVKQVIEEFSTMIEKRVQRVVRPENAGFADPLPYEMCT